MANLLEIKLSLFDIVYPLEIELPPFDKEKTREYEKVAISSNESDASSRDPILDSSRKRSCIPKEESGRKDPLLGKRPCEPKGFSNYPLELEGDRVFDLEVPQNNTPSLSSPTSISSGNSGISKLLKLAYL